MADVFDYALDVTAMLSGSPANHGLPRIFRTFAPDRIQPFGGRLETGGTTLLAPLTFTAANAIRAIWLRAEWVSGAATRITVQTLDSAAQDVIGTLDIEVSSGNPADILIVGLLPPSYADTSQVGRLRALWSVGGVADVTGVIAIDVP